MSGEASQIRRSFEIIVEAAGTSERSPGASNSHSRSDTNSLRGAFSDSPIYKEEITDDYCRLQLINELNKTDLSTPFGEFDMTFGEAPDLNTTRTATADFPNDPSSPFLPNPSSSPNITLIDGEAVYGMGGDPQDQNLPPENYRQIPGGDGYVRIGTGYGSGPAADTQERNPENTSQEIRQRTLRILERSQA